jgi:invasion protein IalB
VSSAAFIQQPTIKAPAAVAFAVHTAQHSTAQHSTAQHSTAAAALPSQKHDLFSLTCYGQLSNSACFLLQYIQAAALEDAVTFHLHLMLSPLTFGSGANLLTRVCLLH